MLGRLKSFLNQLIALRAAHGPYRYLVRRWDKISDIELCEKLLETDFFSAELVPCELPLRKFRRYLVLAPHQDDEVIGAGGTLLMSIAGGAVVKMLFMTDGATEGGRLAKTREQCAEIRRDEAMEVCRRLGAEFDELGLSNIEPAPRIETVIRLAGIIAGQKPDVVLVPWILDLPAKHRMVNHLLWLAEEVVGLPDFEVWGYQVHNSLFPNGYVDISGVAKEKLRLLQCYRSQNEYSQRYDHITMGMAAWNSHYLPDSTEARYIEVFFTVPKDEHLRLVERLYFPDPWKTYRGNRQIIKEMTALDRVTAERKR